jgi:uncharacterized membrane protein YeaQ/YmgE (transglycosylase-associated protein family)
VYLILGIIGFGALIGALAQFILGRQRGGLDWGMAILAGLIGSFVGGLLASLVNGDGLAFKPSGVIGSLIGAVIVTAIWRAVVANRDSKAKAAARANRHSGNPQKRNQAR